MKSLNNYIVERLKLNKDSKIKIRETNKLKETYQFIYKQFMATSFDVEKDMDFINQIMGFIQTYVDNYDFDKDYLVWNEDAPEPIDDYEVVMDHKSFFPNMPKRLGTKEVYYEFIVGPKIIGYTSNDDYYYFYNKK